MSTREAYAAALRQLRAAAGNPPYRDLAEYAGVSYTTAGHVLTGKHFPREKSHDALAGHLSALARVSRDDIDELWRQANEEEVAAAVSRQRNRRATRRAGMQTPLSLSFKIRFLLLAELERLGKTQGWLAEQAGVTEKQLSQMLKARQAMSMANADRLLNALGREFTVGTAVTFGEPTYENWELR